jgi:hypothetical protein
MVNKTVQDEVKESVFEAKLILFDPDDNLPDYIGMNNDPNASDDDEDWRLFKFYYTGSNVIKIIKKTGSWTNRTTYFP